MRLTDHGAETVARRSCAGIAVFETGRDIAHPRSLVERENFDALAFVVLIGADQDFTAGAVFHEVGR